MAVKPITLGYIKKVENVPAYLTRLLSNVKGIELSPDYPKELQEGERIFAILAKGYLEEDGKNVIHMKISKTLNLGEVVLDSRKAIGDIKVPEFSGKQSYPVKADEIELQLQFL